MLSELEFPRLVTETPFSALQEAQNDGYEPIVDVDANQQPIILGFAKARPCKESQEEDDAVVT
jgi:hypothetical protein